MSSVTGVFNIATKYTIADSIGDDSAYSLPSGVGLTPGAGTGAAITKQGVGSLTLTGNNTYSGTTIVNNGVLRVTGRISGSRVNVTSSGILAGDGYTGAIDAAGTVAPGTASDPQGTLNPSGLTLEPGALSCFHASSYTSSRVYVSGAANVDGIVHIDFASGPTVGTTYILIQAGLVSGTFAGVETNMPNLDGVFGYSNTSVTFTVTANDVLFQDGFEQLTNSGPCAAAFAN